MTLIFRSMASIVIETKHSGRYIKEHLPLGDAGFADALSKLDGDRTTVFSVTALGNRLFVGGGDGGRYTVTSLMADGTSSALVGDPQAAGTSRMVVGGQWIDQPRRYIVDADRALKACRCFARQGQLDDEEIWENP